MKKKTITQTVYIAKDGEEFTNEAECLQYEEDGCVRLEPLPDYGDHERFDKSSKPTGAWWWSLYGDGSGYYATATKMSRIPVSSSNHPAWATHIIYFGK